ncbi:hypothetical protein STENM223S_09752 [Streptomyces tendae]
MALNNTNHTYAAYAYDSSGAYDSRDARDPYDARLVQQETAAGAGVQIVLLALLGTAIGMGTAGWVTGLAFAFAQLGGALPGPAPRPAARRSARRTGSPSAGPPWSAG